MRLSLSGKIVLGFLTVSQLFIGLGFLIWFLSELFPAVLTHDDGLVAEALLGSLQGLIIWIVVLSSLSLVLLVFYIIHAATNTALSSTLKAVWIILLLLFGSFVEVVYFFMEIVPNKSMTARLEEV